MNTTTPSGMTLKQFARREFFEALDAYQMALTSRSGIIQASIRVYQACQNSGDRAAVNRAYKATQP